MNQLKINEYYYLDGKEACRLRGLSSNGTFALIEFTIDDEFGDKESIQVLSHRLKQQREQKAPL